jgi:hypothetical protein
MSAVFLFVMQEERWNAGTLERWKILSVSI